MVSYLPTANFLNFLCGLHSACPFSEAMGNTGCFGQCIMVSFSTTCKCISSRFLMCLLLCVLWSLLTPSVCCSFQCICAQMPWATLLQILGCDGLHSLTVWETYGSSCDQHWAVIHLCPHRSTLQPLSTQNTASFPKENSSQKNWRSYDGHTVDELCFHALLKHTSLGRGAGQDELQNSLPI